MHDAHLVVSFKSKNEGECLRAPEETSDRETARSLLLALPLAACAIPTPEQRTQLKANQLADAETTCAARDVGPSDPRYLRCVNFSLRKYGMAAKPLDDGHRSW